MSRGTVPSRARGTLPIRVSEAERAVIEAAAAQRPEYVTTYIREAALVAARRELGEAKAKEREGATTALPGAARALAAER